MSPLPQLPSLPMPSQPSFNREQINQINEFFSSTTGIVTFTLIWLFSVLGIFLFTAWILSRHEKDNIKNPELERERAHSSLTLINFALKEDENHKEDEDCELRVLRPGKYSRML